MLQEHLLIGVFWSIKVTETFLKASFINNHIGDKWQYNLNLTESPRFAVS